MKITVTETTEGVETHKMVVETDKNVITKTVDECIQQRVEELGLVLDYCVYLSPEGKQVRFPLTLKLIDNQKEVAALLGSCPTDRELELMQSAADQEQLERDAWYAEHGMGKDWEASRDQEGYLSSHLVPIGDAAKEAVRLGQEEWIKNYYPDNQEEHPTDEKVWAEGRGYGDFPSEDDYQRWSDVVQGVEVPF